MYPLSRRKAPPPGDTDDGIKCLASFPDRSGLGIDANELIFERK
jgi:hypothetical protein